MRKYNIKNIYIYNYYKITNDDYYNELIISFNVSIKSFFISIIFP